MWGCMPHPPLCPWGKTRFLCPTPDLAPQTGSENRVAWARMSPRPRWLVLVKINESVMKKSKTPHDVPTYGPNDHLGHAANAKHEADWCVRNGDHDRAWGFYHEQQNRYLLHTTKRGSAFTPEATAALISSVNESFANILRLEAKHRQALSHMIYCVAGATKPTKGQLKKLPGIFQAFQVLQSHLS